MTKDEIMIQLEKFGNDQTKKVLLRHGAKEPFFGVKVADLKTIVKKVKKNHELALELYDTGNSDAMYLAGLIADETKMSPEQLNDWAEKAYWYYISDYAVAAVASESPHGWKIALEWIESDKEFVQSAGWATLSACLSIKPDEELDKDKIRELLERVRNNIHQSVNRVRYTMNGFIIAAGAYVPDLTEIANRTGSDVGKVNVDMGGTACKVPLATEYIKKVEDRGKLGQKRKIARC